MDVAQLRKDWDALKLVALKRADLSQHDLQLIADVRKTGASSEALDALCLKLPLTVAKVRPWVAPVLKWASFGRTPEGNMNNSVSLMAGYLFDRDIKKIHETLFGVREKDTHTEFRAGLYKTHMVPRLHFDGEGWAEETRAQYVVRAGALPLEIARPERVAIATHEEQGLIKQANLGMAGQFLQVIAALRSRNIVTAVPLGDVALLAQGPRGTLHCSSPVPPDGAFSIFARYVASFMPS